MRFFFDNYKVTSLSNLAETLDNCDPSFGMDDTCTSPTMLYDMATEVMDITDDGNHCGTMVGLEWFLEQLDEPAVVDMAMENGYDVVQWRTMVANIRSIGSDATHMEFVLITN
jgi:hypothetical protein